MKSQFAIIAIVVALFIGANGLYVVNEAEQAIVTQFGKPVGDVVLPGLHFKLPFVQGWCSGVRPDVGSMSRWIWSGRGVRVQLRSPG